MIKIIISPVEFRFVVRQMKTQINFEKVRTMMRT